MKYLLSVLMALLLLGSTTAHAQNPEQERLDLPGDNLNLYAVLKLFQESPTLEGFERALNGDSANINNLDLNNDDQIDYIQVEDDVQGNIHNIVLKVAVDKDEVQNVAVIIVEKDRDGEAKIQIVGDEDLYGKDYIVEPNYSANNKPGETPNPGYSGQAQVTTTTTVTPAAAQQATVQYTTTYQVATWPIVLFMFQPAYVVWRSPWYWSYYPSYWHPWRPIYWHQYYTYHYYWDYYYFGHYRRWNYYRFPGWHNHYYGAGGWRRRAPAVHVHITRGDFNRTYSRPDMAQTGMNNFRRDHPKAPSLNNKMPVFDKGGRPEITRPARPGGTTRPISRPTNPGGNTRPGVINPGDNTPPGVTRPVIRPTDPVTRPGVKPVPGTNPGDNTRPVIRPTIPTRPTNPGTLPTNPSTRPTNPSTRPTNPSTRPTNPGTRPTQPTTRPTQPSTRPVVKPAQPSTRPATRPTGGTSQPSRPAPRPAPKPASGS